MTNLMIGILFGLSVGSQVANYIWMKRINNFKEGLRETLRKLSNDR